MRPLQQLLLDTAVVQELKRRRGVLAVVLRGPKTDMQPGVDGLSKILVDPGSHMLVLKIEAETKAQPCICAHSFALTPRIPLQPPPVVAGLHFWQSATALLPRQEAATALRPCTGRRFDTQVLQHATAC